MTRRNFPGWGRINQNFTIMNNLLIMNGSALMNGRVMNDSECAVCDDLRTYLRDRRVCVVLHGNKVNIGYRVHKLPGKCVGDVSAFASWVKGKAMSLLY